MFYFIFAYFSTFFVVMALLKVKNKKFQPIKNCKLKKYGLVFSSRNKHRIKIYGAKVLKIENNVYLKLNNRTVVIKNITSAYTYKDFLYFTGLGEVKIVMNCKKFYKYFCVRVESKHFDIEELKIDAINDILEHIFDFNECKNLIRFLRVMREILKIDLGADSVKISKNKYDFAYTLTYIVKGHKKIVHVR